MKCMTMIFALLIICSTVTAARVEDHAKVVVIHFGTLESLVRYEGLNFKDTEKAIYDYIVENLYANNHIELIELREEELKSENINIIGTVNLKEAKRIGEILKVKYIIYGKLLNITADDTEVKILENGLTLHSVRAQIMVRMLNVDTGEIIMAVKGEGKSQSSHIKAGIDNIGVITVGTKKVTQDSVYNAIKKAAKSAVDDLIMALYGDNKNKSGK